MLKLLWNTLVVLISISFVSACVSHQERKNLKVLSNNLPDSYMGTSSGKLYPKGYLPKKSVPSSAFEKLQSIANTGDSVAESKLSQMYLTGIGVKRDIAEGVRLSISAAQKGSASAQHNLAWLYENGTGVDQSWEKAIEWYELAAEQKYAASINNLGRIYDNGYGVDVDYTKAFHYYKQAADLMYIVSQYNVAIYYKLGLHGEQDLEQARTYYVAACLQRLSEACDALERLDSE